MFAFQSDLPLSFSLIPIHEFRVHESNTLVYRRRLPCARHCAEGRRRCTCARRHADAVDDTSSAGCGVGMQLTRTAERLSLVQQINESEQQFWVVCGLSQADRTDNIHSVFLFIFIAVVTHRLLCFFVSKRVSLFVDDEMAHVHAQLIWIFEKESNEQRECAMNRVERQSFPFVTRVNGRRLLMPLMSYGLSWFLIRTQYRSWIKSEILFDTFIHPLEFRNSFPLRKYDLFQNFQGWSFSLISSIRIHAERTLRTKFSAHLDFCRFGVVYRQNHFAHSAYLVGLCTSLRIVCLLSFS